MDINQVLLKGDNWKKAKTLLTPFLGGQPHYELYYLAMSVGIIYDKQLNSAGEVDDEELSDPLYVPKSVLHNHNLDLEYMFQTAVLNTRLLVLDVKERMKLAFDNEYNKEFNRLSFLTKYANFGVCKILEKLTDIEVESMHSLKIFFNSIIDGLNTEIDEISDDEELDIDDDVLEDSYNEDFSFLE